MPPERIVRLVRLHNYVSDPVVRPGRIDLLGRAARAILLELLTRQPLVQADRRVARPHVQAVRRAGNLAQPERLTAPAVVGEPFQTSRLGVGVDE